MTDELPRLLPTGNCWCGCGTEVGLGKFFASGHDKQAEALLLAVKFGGQIAQLLYQHGYGPERSLRDHALETGAAVACGKPGCDYVARPRAVEQHRRLQGHQRRIRLVRKKTVASEAE